MYKPYKQTNRWKFCLYYFHHCCAYCGKPLGNKATIDHLVPRSEGGTLSYGNVIPACRNCNCTRGNKPFTMVPCSIDRIKNIRRYLRICGAMPNTNRVLREIFREEKNIS